MTFYGFGVGKKSKTQGDVRQGVHITLFDTWNIITLVICIACMVFYVTYGA